MITQALPFASTAPPTNGAAQQQPQQPVLLSLALKSAGSTRQGDLSAIETDADRDRLKLGKELYDSAELSDIRKLDSELRRWITRRAVPAPFFRSGVYAVAVALVPDIEAKMSEHDRKRSVLVDLFISNVPRYIEQAQARLSSQFDATDYPTVDRLRGQFSTEFRWFALQTPDSLQSISSEVWEAERNKAAKEWQNALEVGRQSLRQGFAEMVEHMRDRLTPGTDGKPKRFKASSVEGFREFLDVFPFRDATGDTELSFLVERAKVLLEGTSAEALRSSEGLRDAISKGMSEINEQLSPLVELKPTRKIVYTD